MAVRQTSKDSILAYARSLLRAYLVNGSIPVLQDPTEDLCGSGGAFVTLRRDSELRGCIGRILSDKAIWETVRDMTIQAATADPRFPSVTAEEVDDLEIEISLISPMLSIAGPDEIVIGRDGLYIRRGLQTGLLLPQVATSHKMDALEFLQQTCTKAGLSQQAWKTPDTELFRFEADIMGTADERRETQ